MVSAIVAANFTQKDDTNFKEIWNLGRRLTGMLIFVNPSVASLPQHHHLFGGNGCFKGAINNADGGAPCEGVDRLPEEYQSLLDCYRHQDEKDVNVLEKLYLTCNKRYSSASKHTITV